MPGDETDIVIIELDTQEVRETEPERVQTYRRRHEALGNAALSGQAAVDFVLRIADEVRSSIFSAD